MNPTNVYAIASVLLVSVISLMGVFAMSVRQRSLSIIIFVLVSLACGAMAGNFFVHIVPESYENVEAGKISAFLCSVLMLAGFYVSFVMEKVLHFHCGEDKDAHHHDANLTAADAGTTPETPHVHNHIHPTGYLTLVEHGFDNFIDGWMIGMMYMISIPAGVAMTVAIVAHEIPMEFGGFGVLVKAGFSPRKAVLINFLSALVALVGTIIVLCFGAAFPNLPVYMTPIGAGMVVYIVAWLARRLQEECNFTRSLVQMALMGLGGGLMIAAKAFEMWLVD